MAKNVLCSADLLALLLKLLKHQGQLLLSNAQNATELTSSLLFAGFINVKFTENGNMHLF